jgi:signal transduction histidine kinase
MLLHGHNALLSAQSVTESFVIMQAILASFLYVISASFFLLLVDSIVSGLLNKANESRIARETFLNRISHDLRTPLSGIIG